jgi:hypothetical protein
MCLYRRNHTKELVVKKSKSNKVIGYVFPILAFIVGVIILISRNDWRGVILIVMSPFLYYWHNREYQTDEIIIKINALGIWTRDGFSAWEKVDHVKFKYTKNTVGWEHVLDIYISNPFNPDQSISLNNINCMTWTLKRHLKRYTAFKSQNF